MRETTGKVAFITGGASGIGLGMARAFVRAGMRVVIADMRAEALDRAAQALGSDPARVHTLQLDVTDRAALAAAADESERVFGRVHVLCANAGLGDIGYLKDTSYDDWDWIMGVTFGGVVNAVKTFLPRMQAHGERGHIVATSSMGGIAPINHGGVYCVAKFAVVGMMEALRMELTGSKIGVSVLCPGMTRTNIRGTLSLRPERYRNTGYSYRALPPPPPGAPDPMQLAMDPDEVGEKVVRGIRRNDLYILTHSEFAEIIREQFEPILKAMPALPPAARAAGAGMPSMPTPYKTALGSDPADESRGS